MEPIKRNLPRTAPEAESPLDDLSSRPDWDEFASTTVAQFRAMYQKENREKIKEQRKKAAIRKYAKRRKKAKPC